MLKISTVAGLAAVAFTTGAAAQDARTVTEPVIPAFCATLDAQLTSVKQGPYNTLAAADETKLDTARIQSAIDSCAKGKAVALRAHRAANAFLSGPLQLRDGVTLVVDKGATLFASLDPNLYAVEPGTCGNVNTTFKGRGCRPLIAANNVTGAGIMGDGVIDGRGGLPQLGKTESAWDLALKIGPSGNIIQRLLVTNHANDFTLYRITFRNSPNFNISYNGGDGFTVWGIKIDSPHRVPGEHSLARNTDGIDPGNGSKNITITHSFIRAGDDNVAIKGGAGGVTNMTVSHNHFYWGHGMSIGSETYGGVSKLRVFDLTEDGTDAGIRIKSAGNRGGLVHDVSYEDICIRNVRNPIILTGSYSSDGAALGSRPPVYRDVTLKNVAISGGGQLVFSGYDHDHRAEATLDGVFLTDAATAKYSYVFEHADVIYGKGGSNITLPAGTDTTVSGAPVKGPGDLPSCTGRFVPFPE